MESVKKFVLFLVLFFKLCFVYCHPNYYTDGSHSLGSYEVVFGWKQLDFSFTSPQMKSWFLRTGQFIPENNVPVGIKLWGSKLFLTVPRWRRGVPSTLNVIDLNNPRYKSGASPHQPLLTPFPSWEMQEISNCSALQFIMSMEIDEFGRMWIVDVGRLYFSEDPAVHDNSCPPKLVIIDLATNQIIRRHTFPQSVVSRTKSFLNDITLGCEPGSPDKCFAYINDQLDPKLVIYNFEEDRSHFVFHRSFVLDPEATTVNILGRNYIYNSSHINGIALSPKLHNHDRIYYNSLASFSLFSTATYKLKEALNGEILKDVDITTHTTQRASQMTGMAMDASGILYYAQLRYNSLAWVNTSAPGGFYRENLLLQSDKDLQWPDCYGFSNDNEGYLYFTTNRLQLFNSRTINWEEINFRVIRTRVGAKSAMYFTDDEAHEEFSTKPAHLYPIDDVSTKSELDWGNFKHFPTNGNSYINNRDWNSNFNYSH